MEKLKVNLVQDLKRIFKPVIILIYQPAVEIIIGIREQSLPLIQTLLFGIIVSQMHYWGAFGWFLQRYGLRFKLWPLFDGIMGASFVFSGMYFWGLRQVGLRRRLQEKLEAVFAQGDLKTKLNEYPEFIFDRPIGTVSRKLRLRAVGIPISSFKKGLEYFEAGLNINVSKIENPENNKEVIDINYSTEKIPEFWELDQLLKYKNFSFPVGKTVDREIVTNLRKIPHYLIAGETNSGKSTFIRSMVAILVMNNFDLKVVFVDMKGKMDAQVFNDFDNVEVQSTLDEIDKSFASINSMLDTRMSDAEKKQAKNIDEYNKKTLVASEKWHRILVVVDEIAELMPSMNSTNKAKCSQIQNQLSRFTRLGRAVGIHVVVGVQKPDHKNLDATIKANLPGIVCFPVSHFSQSTLVLGNGHAAELNASIVGRGIWKYGLEEIEIQAPFLMQEEIDVAKFNKNKYFHEVIQSEGGLVNEETKSDSESTYFKS